MAQQGKVMAADSPVRLDLVYNPASGHFRQDRLNRLAAALTAHGFAPTPIATTPHGIPLSEDAQIVCVHGGDGAIRLAVQALGERADKVALCIAPCGTINLIARELGYSHDPEAFAARLAEAWRQGDAHWLRSPMLACSDMPVMSCLSIGPDSAAVASVDTALKTRIGRYAYGVAAAKLLWHWPHRRFRVQAELLDGTQIETQSEAAFVARGRFYAGPFQLSPKASLVSEAFELVLLPRAGRLRSAAFALAVALGLPVDKLGLASVHTVRRASFPDGGLPVQVDGDAVAATSITAGMTGMVARFCV